MYLKRKTFAFNADNPGEMNQNRDVFESVMKTADVTFQNLDSSEISLTDVSHYFDSDPTNLIKNLRDDGKAPNSYIIEGSGNSPVGFASGEAKVKLEDSEGGTKLSYEVEANVGGKIAQIGSRLIDMTAKKMADIFFGKFSELLSSQNNKNEKSKTLNKINNKKFIYISLLVLLVIVGYFII